MSKKITKALDVSEIVLGRGGFGEVRKGTFKTEEGQKVDVAIKFLTSTDPNYAPYFERESEMLIGLDHPNVVKAYTKGIYSGKMYLVMEFLKNGSLQDFLLKYKGTLQVTEEEARGFTEDILKGLEYLHDKKIIHRDIKLENVLVTDDNKLKITDFGLSKPKQASTTIVKNMKQSVLGTPGFIAPEIVSGKYTEMVDIFALGMLVYVLLAGQLHNKEANLEDNSIKGFKLQDVDFKAISPEATEFLKRCLDENPNKRLSARQLLNSNWIKGITSAPAGVNLKNSMLILTNMVNENAGNQFAKAQAMVMEFIGIELNHKITQRMTALYNLYEHIESKYMKHILDMPELENIAKEFMVLFVLMLNWVSTLNFKITGFEFSIDCLNYGEWKNNPSIVEIIQNFSSHYEEFDSLKPEELASQFQTRAIKFLEKSESAKDKFLVAGLLKCSKKLINNFWLIVLEVGFNPDNFTKIDFVKISKAELPAFIVSVKNYIEKGSGAKTGNCPFEFKENTSTKNRQKIFDDCSKFMVVNVYFKNQIVLK